MKIYYAYTRISTIKQGENGISLVEQRESIERYTHKHRLFISEWHEEQLSAAKNGHPVFTSLVKALRKNKAQGLIVHKIDKSARNLKDWASIGELIDQGIVK